MSTKCFSRAKQLTVIVLMATLCFAAGCGKKGPTAGGQYHIDQDGYGFGPKADQIILTLNGDGKFDVKAGPVLMHSGTWEAKENMLSFSSSQGAIVDHYRIEDKKLIPLKDGQEVKGWRWAK